MVLFGKVVFNLAFMRCPHEIHLCNKQSFIITSKNSHFIKINLAHYALALIDLTLHAKDLCCAPSDWCCFVRR